MPIVRARRHKARLRLAISGPSKHGKSYSALSVATGLIKSLEEMGELEGNGRILVIDTEHESSLKYAMVDDNDVRPGAFDFDLSRFDGPYSPENYIKLLREGEAQKYSVIIIDQISHEWDGTGGTLQSHAKIAADPNSKKNSYTAWQETTPRHQAFVEAWNSSPGHVICTMRAKVKYRVTKDGQKTEIVKLGFKPIARDTTEYEFDAYGMMAVENRKHVIKFEGSRCPAISHQTIIEPGEDLGRVLAEWLCLGTARTEVERGALDAGRSAEIARLVKEAGFTNDDLIAALAARGVTRVSELSGPVADEMIGNLKAAAKEAARKAKAVQKATARPEPEPAPEPAAPADGITDDTGNAIVDLAEALGRWDGCADGRHVGGIIYLMFGQDSGADSIGQLTEQQGLALLEHLRLEKLEEEAKAAMTQKGKVKTDGAIGPGPRDPITKPAAAPTAADFEALENQWAAEKATPNGDQRHEPADPFAGRPPLDDLETEEAKDLAYDYASTLADKLGYDYKKFGDHVVFHGAGHFLSLSPDGIRGIIADLENMTTDRLADPDNFNLDDWVFEQPKPEPPPAPKPKGRPKAKAK